MKAGIWVRRAMPSVEAPLVHAGIVLTVAGVSRCVSLEAYAAISVAPLVAGTGLAVAVDAPIVAEACGMGSIAAVEDVEVKILGRGLHYSTPGLDKVLADLATRLYSEGEDAIRLERLHPGGLLPASAIAAYAALGGTRAFVAGYPFPLGELEGYWAVAVHLKRRVAALNAVEALYGDPDEFTGLVLDSIENGVEGIAELGLHLAQLAGAERIVRKTLRAGADAALLDASGRVLLALVEDEIAASLLSAKLRALGDRYEGIVVA